MPAAGTEVWADGMGSCPGGIANLAIASSRLGLRTSLAAAFGDDDYGDFCWRTLAEQEHVDLPRSRRFQRWHSPVTVSMAVNRDRSMVTHGHDAPVTATEMIGRPPRSRAVFVDLDLAEPLGTSDRPTWADLAQRRGRPGLRRRRLGPHRRLVRPTSSSSCRPATRSCPTPARRWPTRAPTPRTTRSTPSPTGSRSPW